MEMKVAHSLVEPPQAEPHVGRPQRRIEDVSLLVGRGQYGDDVGVKPGTLFAAIVRSPHAHAVLKSVDAGPAECTPC
jgi:2-furoyl-CoA dehydrogenase large subunit